MPLESCALVWRISGGGDIEGPRGEGFGAFVARCVTPQSQALLFLAERNHNAQWVLVCGRWGCELLGRIYLAGFAR
jgi:hypothetical protein